MKDPAWMEWMDGIFSVGLSLALSVVLILTYAVFPMLEKADAECVKLGFKESAVTWTLGTRCVGTLPIEPHVR